MKKVTLLIFFIIVYSCKKSINTEKTKTETEFNNTKRNIEEKFVIAKSGLNYRTKKLDIVLGKFDYREKIEILKYTTNHTSIFDNGYLIKGEWVGVKTDKDTAYVFGGYLSNKIDDKIKKSKKRLRYLYFSNGGLIGYFSNGSIAGCPRCDLVPQNIEVLYESESIRNYTVNDKGEITENWSDNYSESFSPKNENDIQEWAIINYKEVLK